MAAIVVPIVAVHTWFLLLLSILSILFSSKSVIWLRLSFVDFFFVVTVTVFAVAVTVAVTAAVTAHLLF